MTREYREHQQSIEIPRNTGVAGLLAVMKKIIELPRVQTVLVDGRRGSLRVEYLRYVTEEEADAATPLQINLETLEPYAVLRNGEIKEVQAASKNAAVVIAQLFREVSAAGLWPVALVGGANTRFWSWHLDTTGVDASPSAEDAYGLPFLSDRHVEDGTLLVAAAYSRSASLIDARMAFKLAMPAAVSETPPTTVEVLQ